MKLCGFPPNTRIHALPNGGSAMVNETGNMLAYKRHGIGLYKGQWDWIKPQWRG